MKTTSLNIELKGRQISLISNGISLSVHIDKVKDELTFIKMIVSNIFKAMGYPSDDFIEEDIDIAISKLSEFSSLLDEQNSFSVLITINSDLKLNYKVKGDINIDMISYLTYLSNQFKQFLNQIN